MGGIPAWYSRGVNGDPLGDVPADYSESWVAAAGGVELRVLRWTPRVPAVADPLLFVAGWISVVEGWLPVLRRLVVRRPVVYVETREKRSARFPRPPRAEDFAIGRLADDLVAVCRRLGLDDGRTALFGSSMGSNAILEALKHGRLRARSAFVVGPNATFTPPWWGRGLVALPVAAYGLIREPLIWYLRRFRVNAREDPEQMRRYERTLRSADPLRLKLSARAVAGYDARPGLETIAVPVTVAYAEADTLHDAEPIRQLAERIPVGETMTFASSTAMHREEVVEPLERFIDRC